MLLGGPIPAVAASAASATPAAAAATAILIFSSLALNTRLRWLSEAQERRARLTLAGGKRVGVARSGWRLAAGCGVPRMASLAVDVDESFQIVGGAASGHTLIVVCCLIVVSLCYLRLLGGCWCVEASSAVASGARASWLQWVTGRDRSSATAFSGQDLFSHGLPCVQS